MSNLKSGADFVQALRHLMTAQEYFESVMRDHPTAPMRTLIKNWNAKIRWVLFDVKTTPLFDGGIVDALREELKSDPFVFAAIQEKMAIMSPEQRLKLEEIADLINQGKDLIITECTPTEQE
jgi:hypothetical protein